MPPRRSRTWPPRQAGPPPLSAKRQHKRKLSELCADFWGRCLGAPRAREGRSSADSRDARGAPT
eukprot:3023657-Pyramimonas_sp.AAC.1